MIRPLTDDQKIAVRKLLDLAKTVSEIESTAPLAVLELAADRLTWEKIEVLRAVGEL